MSSSAHVPPKRAPLGTRSNKAPGNLQGFEYSNKHRTSKLQPLATHHNDSENTLNRKSTISNSEKSKRVSFGLSNNEEKVRGFAEATTSTQTSAATKSTTPLQVARQPLGLRGIRQSLRETISPLPLKARKQTPARPSVGMTSLVDMTPRSLLRSELDETDELFEESLLLSPAISSKKYLAIRSVAQDVSHSLVRAADRCAEAIAKMDETSLPSAQRMGRLQSDSILQTARVNKKADEAKVIALHSNPEFAASAIAAYRAPRTTFSPLIGTNAVCMDLSGMFRDVASTTKPTPLSKFTMSLQSRLAMAKKPIQTSTAPNTHTVSIKKSIPLRPKEPRLPPSESIAISDNSQEWSIKQCETFTNWLNFTIQPPDEDEELIASVDEKNRSALRCLLMHQQLAQARQRASILYKSKIMDLVRKAIGNEIAKGKMTLRKDKDLNADLTLRKQIINQLLSYSTPFLRVCLETMFGTLIDPQALIEASAIREKLGVKGTIKKGSTMSRMKVALKQFLVTKVLSDDKTLAKYTKHHCKVPSGRFGIEYQAEMQALILNRLIILFVFLDKCKEANIIDKAPKLFEDTAPVKSSRDVLLMFSREYLSAEGDFVKHLSRIGVKVSYVQNPIDELEFAVSNLATDLRDGVKLARMTEVLRKIPRTTILGSLRLPAVSRLQKLHNLGLVLHNLRAFGIPIPVDIAPHHIVDSHREIVLKLLWSVVAHCCINDLVDFDRMRNEVTRIERLNSFRGISNSLQNVSSNPGDTLNDEQTLKSLLKRWSKAICIRFHVSVQNLSSDFADGKALCLLIHYYQPTILRQNEIKDTTRDLPSACRFLDDVVEKARANERYNISLANSRLAELGGIPKMIPACDTSAIPDEKSMLLCLAYMFSRLFEANGEVRAAVMIQRNYRRCRRIIEMQLKEAAARLIYSTWCKHKNDFYANRRLKYAHAVRVIERFVTMNSDGILRMKRNRVVGEQYCRSATILQAYIRRSLAQDRYFSMLQLHQAAVLLQTRWRSFVARRRYTTMIRQSKAATIIKNAWDRCQSRRDICITAAIDIQRTWRGFWDRLQCRIDVQDIICVQSCVRRFFAVKAYQRRASAALLITRYMKDFLLCKHHQTTKLQLLAAVNCQAAIRSFLAQRRVIQIRAEHYAAINIQAICRRRLVQTRVHKMHLACRIIQAQAKMVKDLKHYRRVRQGVLHLQSAWRGLLVFNKYQEMIGQVRRCQATARRFLARLERDRRIVQRDGACITLQALIRGYSARRGFVRAVESIIVIQKLWKMSLTRKGYSNWRSSLLICQKMARTWLACRAAVHRSFAILKIQSGCRVLLAKRDVSRRSQQKETEITSAITLQRIWRGLVAYQKYRISLSSAITLQSMLRAVEARRRVHVRRYAIRALQCSFRCFLAQRVLNNLKIAYALKEERRRSSALDIQSLHRGYLVRRELACLRNSATQIQRIVRGFVAYTNYGIDRTHVICIQTLARMVLAQREASQRRDSILQLQSYARRFIGTLRALSLRRVKETEVLEFVAASTFQRLFRGHRARMLYKVHSAARKIQKTWRCYTVHVDFLLSFLATIDIQTCVRRHLAILQSERRLAAVYTLQDFVEESLVKIRAAKTVQRYVRGNIVRSNLRSLSSSACEIQRVWRGYLEFCKFTCDRWAAVRIQTVLRVALAKNYLDQLYLEQDIQFIRRKSSALAIQRRFRLYIWERLQRSAASTIQSSVRRFLARCRSKRQRYGLVRLQSFARAHHVRRKRDKATKILANKIAKANKNAIKNPGMRLDNRCSAALSVLQTSHRLAQVASAIKTLETATKLSEVCCQSFTDAGAARIILNLISTCNRSLPHVEILHSTMQALTNVAKYEYLLPSLATQLAVETFLNLVQMFRDKESIFTLTTALLERVVFYQKSLLTICKAKDNVKRLHGIVALCERRTGLDHNASALNGRRVTRLSLVNDSSKGLRSLKRIIAAASIV